MIALAAFYLLPVYLLVITSLKRFAEVSLSRMWDLPRGLYFESFARAWEVMGRSFLNSVRLVIDGLQEGHIHELVSAGIKSAAGLPLLHKEAYSTLSRIPR